MLQYPFYKYLHKSSKCPYPTLASTPPSTKCTFTDCKILHYMYHARSQIEYNSVVTQFFIFYNFVSGQNKI